MNLTASFQAALAASWQGSVVILLILLLRPLLGLRVPPGWRSLLWALVLLRLLLPAFLLPPSAASLQNLAVVDRPLEQAARVFPALGSEQAVPLRARAQGPEADDSALAERLPAAPHRRSWWTLAGVVWLGGAALCGLWLVAATAILHRRVRRETAPAEEAAQRLWKECCAQAGVAHPPRLRAARWVESPALLGLLRPVLLVPADALHTLSPAEWEHIFLHELAHFRRRDHWVQALQLLALSVHWFNPLVWLGFRYLRADRELAADDWALRHLAGTPAVAYGDTLLKVLAAQTRGASPAGVLGLMEDAAQLKQRLRHIVAFRPRRLVGSLVGGVTALVLAAVVLGRQLEQADLTKYEGLPPAAILVTAAREGDRPAVEKMLADGVDVNGIATVRGERTALTAAVAANQLEVARLLVDKGADVNLQPEKSDPPLVVAWKRGRTEAAELLLGKGATYSPEMLAVAKGDAPAVAKFLATKPTDSAKLKTLCEIAAAHGHAALVATLYDAINTLPGERYWRADNRFASTAIARGHRAVVEELLRRERELPNGSVARFSAAAAAHAGMREWLNSIGFKVPEYTDGERLIDAAERENLPEMRRLLEAGTDVNYRGESFWTPLTKASTWGSPRAVKLLLEHHADPNLEKNQDYSPLCLAKTAAIADLLLAAGAKLETTANERGLHPIFYCVSQGNAELVKWFLDHGVDPAKVKIDGVNLLGEAGSREVAELLLARGLDWRAEDKGGRSALWWVMYHERPAPVVAALLKHGLDPNTRLQNGYPLLRWAPDGETVDLLVAAGADVHAKDNRGIGVLAGVHPFTKPSRLEALLRHGCPLDEKTGNAMLREAISQDKVGEVKALFARGLKLMAVEKWVVQDFSPLSVSIAHGHFEMARLLREAGANDVGLFSEAAARGDLAEMKRLLDSGADVNELSGGINQTPLQLAIYQAQVAAVQLLLERGANVNSFDASGSTAAELTKMMLAQVDHAHFSPVTRLSEAEAKAAFTEISAALAARHPDINYRNPAGETALMQAAKNGFAIWWTKGADVNVQRPDGMTALMLAIVTRPKAPLPDEYGKVTMEDPAGGPPKKLSSRAYMVKALLDLKTDLTLRNRDGKTALDLARELGDAEILALVEAAEKP